MRQAARTGWIAILFLGLSGCGGQEVTTAALDAAQRKWDAAHIRDYDLEWTSSGLMDGHYLVYVRDGRVKEIRSVLPDGRQVAAKPARPEMYGVDGLFKIIEEEKAQIADERPFGQPKGAAILLKFTPDPKLGYPSRYRRDVVGSPKGLAIDVLKIDTRPVETIPPLPKA